MLAMMAFGPGCCAVVAALGAALSGRSNVPAARFRAKRLL